MCLALGAEVNDASCLPTKKKGNSPWRTSLGTEREELKKEGEGDCYKHQENMGNQEMGYTEKQKNQ